MNIKETVAVEDDQQFESAIEKAIEMMGKKGRLLQKKRQRLVLARLEEEMAKLRPQKNCLLTGPWQTESGSIMQIYW